jgi:hypothetical protein
MTTQSVKSLAWKQAERARRSAESRRRTTYPPPRTPRIVTEPDSELVPRGVRTVYNNLTKAGWRARITRAVGPRINAAGEVAEERCATICVAAQAASGARLIYEWRWLVEKQEWKFVDAVAPQWGASMTSTEAKMIVAREAS